MFQLDAGAIGSSIARCMTIGQDDQTNWACCHHQAIRAGPTASQRTLLRLEKPSQQLRWHCWLPTSASTKLTNTFNAASALPVQRSIGLTRLWRNYCTACNARNHWEPWSHSLRSLPLSLCFNALCRSCILLLCSRKMQSSRIAPSQIFPGTFVNWWCSKKPSQTPSPPPSPSTHPCRPIFWRARPAVSNSKKRARDSLQSLAGAHTDKIKRQRQILPYQHQEKALTSPAHVSPSSSSSSSSSISSRPQNIISIVGIVDRDQHLSRDRVSRSLFHPL